jgi:hypothetical protein
MQHKNKIEPVLHFG